MEVQKGGWIIKQTQFQYVERKLEAIECELRCVKQALPGLSAKLDMILVAEGFNIIQGEIMADNIDTINEELAGETDAVKAMGLAVDKLVALVEAAGNDPVKVKQALDTIRANKASIVAFTLKGTPAEAPPVEEVPPVAEDTVPAVEDTVSGFGE